VGPGSRVSLNNIVEVRATNRWLCLGLTVAVQSDTSGLVRPCLTSLLLKNILKATQAFRNTRDTVGILPVGIFVYFGDATNTLSWLKRALASGLSAAIVRDTPNFYSLRLDPGFQELIQAKKDSPFYYTQFSNLEPYSGLVRREVLGDRRKYSKYTVRTLNKSIDPGGVVNP
jgi:hypothetical protein